MNEKTIPHIVIVGGGAGGLELATSLGKKFGKHKSATITLVDASPTHVWKPLLHEVAAGSLNSHEDELNYLAFASAHYFKFVLGIFEKLDRVHKKITLGPITNSEGQTLISERTIDYDILIISVGSVTNDFNIPGVSQNCLFLDNRQQADLFHRHLLNKLFELSQQRIEKEFNIVIIGAGATGIELTAELHHSVRLMAKYGMNIDPQKINFTLIESAKTLLPMLPARLSNLISKQLDLMKVKMYLGEEVIEVEKEGLKTRSGKFIPADIMVWTAGIKAPDFLKNLAGLESNLRNQLLVKMTLQTTQDESIFAFGDCASCPQPHLDFPVPPRAQAAHQEAKFLTKSLEKWLQGKPLPDYRYHDYGSLVTLSRYDVVGSLMGKLTKSVHVEGLLARFFYFSLYKQHQAALFGWWRVILLSIADLLSRRVKPRLKLH